MKVENHRAEVKWAFNKRTQKLEKLRKLIILRVFEAL